MTGVRFCPFCKEPFDGAKCPDHGLPLVSLVELASVGRIPHESEELASTDFRFGRRTLLIGASIVLVGFGLPLVVDGSRGDQATTTFELWQLRADYLGVVPAAAISVVVLAFTRRSRRELSRARVAMGIAWLVAVAALAVGASKVVAYSSHLDRIGAANDLHVAHGAFVIAAGIAILGYGIARLGLAPRR